MPPYVKRNAFKQLLNLNNYWLLSLLASYLQENTKLPNFQKTVVDFAEGKQISFVQISKRYVQ